MNRLITPLGLLMISGCGFNERVLAAPATPERIVPRVADAPPPEAGKTPLAIDVVDADADVAEIDSRHETTASMTVHVAGDATHVGGLRHGQWITAPAHDETYVATSSSLTSHPLCRAPCVANLAPGAHALSVAYVKDGISQTDEVDVDVGSRPGVLRVVPAEKHRVTSGKVVTIVLLYGIGVPTLLMGPAAIGLGLNSNTDSLTATGVGMLIGGAVLTGVAVLVDMLTRPTSRPHAVKHWEPSDGVVWQR